MDSALQMDNVTEVKVTERAARQIGAILRKEPPGSMLRVSVEGGGCSGFQYKFDVEQAQAADDLVISRDGATVLVDQVSLGYLAGSERSEERRGRERERPRAAVAAYTEAELT